MSIFRNKACLQFPEARRKLLLVCVASQVLVSSWGYGMVKYGDVHTFLVKYVQVVEEYREKKTAMGRKPAGGHTQPTAEPARGTHSRQRTRYWIIFFVQAKMLTRCFILIRRHNALL